MRISATRIPRLVSPQSLWPRRYATSVIVPPTKTPEPQMTTLPNKIRVITGVSPQHISTVGIVVDAGSRYESERTSGCGHLLDKLALKATKRYTDEKMTTSLHDIGSTVLTSTQRDFSFSSALTFPSKLPLALSLLSSSLIEPLLLPQDLEQAKQAAAYESSLSFAKANIIMPDLVHSTAYSGATLGMPTICPEDQLDRIGERELRGYLNDWVKPERIVIAGLGMQHEDLVEMVEREFEGLSHGNKGVNTSAATASLPGSLGRVSSGSGSASGSGGGVSSWWGKTFATVSSAPEPEVPLESDFTDLALAKAVYTGGERYVEKPDEDFCHLSITFESPHITDDDVYATAVLQSLLGGGSSFSQGGPGKGMYSRLQLNLLNRNHLIENSFASHTMYTDSGLFGISMSIRPEGAARAASLICAELHGVTGDMSGGIRRGELDRAKNMLKSLLAMSVESRMVGVEDLGRQILTQNRVDSVQEMCDKIDAVTTQDIHRIANRIFRPSSRTKPMNFGLGSGKPTIVAIGKGIQNLGDVPAMLRRWDLGAR